MTERTVEPALARRSPAGTVAVLHRPAHLVERTLGNTRRTNAN